MSDIEIIYNCVHDKTYQDKIELELILEQVKDKKLVKGFLTQLYSNSEGYEINKEIPVELISSILGETPDKEDLVTSVGYYNEKMKELNDFTMNKNEFLISFLNEIKSSIKVDEYQELKKSDINYEKLEEMLKSCKDKRYIEYVKYSLLKYEIYEFLKIVDKYLN